MSKDAATTFIKIAQKDFNERDFFRTKPILDVKLDVKIGGGGEIERVNFCIVILGSVFVCV
ncbi:MAG: hypothetical protein LBK06_06060 [Planctomycetaceae bacterium]|nr:hypothetical protein [Planctomycetaceae bacterium]